MSGVREEALPGEPARPATAELQPCGHPGHPVVCLCTTAAPVTTCGCPTCREHCVHPTMNRQYGDGGLTFFCTRCGGRFRV